MRSAHPTFSSSFDPVKKTKLKQQIPSCTQAPAPFPPIQRCSVLCLHHSPLQLPPDEVPGVLRQSQGSLGTPGHVALGDSGCLLLAVML